MKQELFIISVIQSNVCEVQVYPYKTFGEAIKKWDELMKEHEEYIKEAIDSEVIDYEDVDTTPLKDMIKYLSYDDGQYFNSLEMKKYEV